MSNDSAGFLEGNGSKYFPFKNIGDSITGVIAEDPQEKQQTKIGTDELLTWPDGNPKKVLIITLQTDLRDPENADDEGLRTVWAPNPGGIRAALIKAVKAAGAKQLDVGGKLTVTFVSEGERSNPAFNPPKQYSASYAAPSGALAAEVAAAADAPANLPAGMSVDVWNGLSAEAKAALGALSST